MWLPETCDLGQLLHVRPGGGEGWGAVREWPPRQPRHVIWVIFLTHNFKINFFLVIPTTDILLTVERQEWRPERERVRETSLIASLPSPDRD